MPGAWSMLLNDMQKKHSGIPPSSLRLCVLWQCCTMCALQLLWSACCEIRCDGWSVALHDPWAYDRADCATCSEDSLIEALRFLRCRHEFEAEGVRDLRLQDGTSREEVLYIGQTDSWTQSPPAHPLLHFRDFDFKMHSMYMCIYIYISTLKYVKL